MPAFFIPDIETGKQDEVYQTLAELAGAGIPAPEERVFSITWKRDSGEWTATVGEQLKGIEIVTKGRGRQKRVFELPRSTNDTVLAIFPGVPFLIMHNNASRLWNVPILAGSPTRVVRFQT